MYEERLHEFGPAPDDVRLLRTVYEQLIPYDKKVPTNVELKDWTAGYWKELFLSKKLDAGTMIGAGKI